MHIPCGHSERNRLTYWIAILSGEQQKQNGANYKITHANKISRFSMDLLTTTNNESANRCKHCNKSSHCLCVCSRFVFILRIKRNGNLLHFRRHSIWLRRSYVFSQSLRFLIATNSYRRRHFCQSEVFWVCFIDLEILIVAPDFPICRLKSTFSWFLSVR